MEINRLYRGFYDLTDKSLVRRMYICVVKENDIYLSIKGNSIL